MDLSRAARAIYKAFVSRELFGSLLVPPEEPGRTGKMQRSDVGDSSWN